MSAAVHDQGMELPPLTTTKVLKSHPSAQTNGTAADGHKGETDLPPEYLAYLSELKNAWTDLPDLSITYKDFGYSAQVPVERNDIPNLYTAFRDGFNILNPWTQSPFLARKEFKALSDATGIVRPGEMTLILAPPGHGKSLLLKGLAGRLEREKSNLRGEIRWNGLTAEQSAASGQQLSKLCAFVEQGDVHYPMLTVRETFQFALENSNADMSQLGTPELARLQAKKVELMLELLGLKECADTVVGNNMIRGISGGQKKRVTLGEMMIGQARALFLDEISTGLDAAATFDIVSALKKWTRVMRGSATVALLQPAPEVFEMFDNIILLRAGCVVFSGKISQLKQHFIDINIIPDTHIDFADWLTEFLTDPPAIWQRGIEHRGRPELARQLSEHDERPPQLNEKVSVKTNTSVNGEQSGNDSPISSNGAIVVEPPKEVIIHLGPDEGVANEKVAIDESRAVQVAPRAKGLGQIVTSAGIPLSTAALKKAFEDSKVYQDLKTEVTDTAFTLEKKYLSPDQPQPTLLTKTQYYQSQSWSLWHHTVACLHRQYLFTIRSPEFILPRIGQAIFMGLVMGSLFYQLGVEPQHTAPRLGVILFGLAFIAFANMPEIPIASEFKLVVYKQVDAGFYNTFSYVFSVVIMHMPIAIAECFIFGTLVYWMGGFDPNAGHYFFYLFVVLMGNLCLGAVFRTVAYLTDNPDIALNFSGPITAIFMLFGGFLLTFHKIPDWLIWCYYISPFSWGLRSAALNEFHSPRYNGVGDSYLQIWQIDTRDEYRWMGILYQAVLFLVVICISAGALIMKRSWLTIGTRRIEENEEIDQGTLSVRIGAKTTSMALLEAERVKTEQANQLTFDKMDLSFVDLKYSVPVTQTNKETGKEEIVQRQLLSGINGYARAGELTALMGSSGAGKTTLMDVIAGRKTAGTISGQILVDGHPQTFPTFNRLMGYCEQQDVHIGTDTVREAIEFSARLRLPETVSAEARQKFVEQILDDLELTPIADRLIGDANIEGLSPGQLKRVTIGVELAANPTFLFLDEPTSGLDSRAALIVLRVIHKISRRGRAVVCTIHQPSAELFCMFDRLLLLKSGGKEVYFGPVGEDGVDLVSYFMNAPIGPEYFRPSLPQSVNPASWMLDVIGAGTSAKGKIAAYDEVYKASPLREQNMAVVKQLSTPRADKPAASFDSPYACSYGQQFYWVLYRLFRVYYRDNWYSAFKFGMMVFMGTMFGLVYQNISDADLPGMSSKLASIYMGAGFIGVLQSSTALPIIQRLRGPFYRERAANTYAPFIYSTSLGIVELPYLFICTFLFTLPFYFIVHYEYDGNQFFRYVFIMYLESLFFSYLGQLFASITPTVQVANIIQGLAFTFFFLFAGVFIQKDVIPAGWIFAYYINPVTQGLIPLAIEQYYCSDARTDCPTFDYQQADGSVLAVKKWTYVADFLSSGKGWEDYYIGWFLFMIVCMRILVAVAIQKVSFLKR